MISKRKWVTLNVYNEVLRRDAGLCQLCNTPVNTDKYGDAVLHHISYENSEPENLIALCRSCHCKLHWKQRRARREAEAREVGGRL
jgi:5-methylcytosine-specific restriction endonuclease McrA